MGMTRGAIKLLTMTLHNQQYKRAAMYGVQEISVKESEINSILSEYDIDWLKRKEAHPSTNLFKSLGCKQVNSIDIYPDESPTHLIDLNLPIDQGYNENFDLIYDGGTIEHCFNIPQVLRNTAAMLEIGGRVIHHTPTNNWVDHGFYQISPTLFFDFYEAAGFDDFSFHFHFINGQKEKFIPYNLQEDPPPYFIGKGQRVLSHFTAIKKKHVDPSMLMSLVQRRYRDLFGNKQSIKTSPKRGLANRLKRSFLKRTILLRSKQL